MSRASLVRKKSGILLDLSLGGTPQPNSVTCAELRMDPRQVEWPLPSHSVHTAVCTHVLEYVDPPRVWQWFDELHRVMRPGGIGIRPMMLCTDTDLPQPDSPTIASVFAACTLKLAPRFGLLQNI